MARQAWDLVSTPFQGPAKPQCLLCEPISESYLSSPAGRLGPSTLAEQCIRVAANNLNDLDAQCLDGLPAHLLGEIWQFVANHKKALSFKAWKLFASIMSRDRDTAKCMSYSLTRWFSSIPGDLTAPLSEYLSPLASDTFEFLTHLTIAGRVNVETHDLLQLGQLRNLAVLEFIEPLLNHDVPTEFPRVSDSIVREWARQTDPFPLLRILRVWGCHFTTTRSLQYLDAFPSLVVYDVAGKKNDWRDRDNYSAYWICRTNKVSRQIIKHLAKYAKQLYTNLDEENWEETYQRRERDTIEHSFRNRIASDVDHRLSDPDMRADSQARWEKTFYQKQLHDDGLLFFLLYCQIGAMILNRDLRDLGITPWDHLTTLNKTVVPALPLASLTVGKRPPTEDCKDAFEVQYTFIKKHYQKAKEGNLSSNPKLPHPDSRKRNVASSPSSQPRKRRHVTDILESFR